MKRKFLSITLLSLGLFLFSTCSGEGLFYQIQIEEETADNALDNVKFEDILVTDQSDGSGYYVARGTRIWTREKIEDDWVLMDKNSSVDNISSIAYYNDKLYYTTREDDDACVYELDINTDGPGEGTKVKTISSASGYYVFARLFANEDGDRIFLNAVEYDGDDDDLPVMDSDLYYQDSLDIDETSMSERTNLDLEDMPIRRKGIAFGNDGFKAWIICNDVDDDEEYEGGNLYSSTDNFDSDINTESTDDAWFNAIYCTSSPGTDLVVISGREDSQEFHTYYNYDANGDGDDSWDDTGEQGEDAYFSCFLDVSDSDLSSEEYILAGTQSDNNSYDAQGYFLITMVDSDEEIDEGEEDEDDDFADETNYESTDLNESTIYAMAYDKEPYDSTGYYILAAASTGMWIFDSATGDWTQQ